jgi:membrane-associated phospholipid phosphatase
MNVALLIMLLAVKTMYLPLNRRKSKYYFESSYDKYIPLVPWFVIPYIAYFPFIVIAITRIWNTPNITAMLISMIVAYLVAITIWYIWPNGVARPSIENSSLMHRVLAFVYRSDGDTNGFPSAHVFVSLMCGYYLALTFPQYAWVAWSSAGAISLSTLFTKQHYIFDIPGGILVFAVAVFAGNTFV